MKLKRLGIPFLAISACFYPTWVAILNGIGLQKVNPAANDFGKICNWDCLHYSGMVTHFEPTAFFPLLPLISKIWHDGFGVSPNLSVMITSVLFTYISCYALLFLGRELADPEAPRYYEFPKESWILLLLVTLFPHFHFWTVGYSEPVFFAFLVIGSTLLLQKKYIPACLVLGVTTVARGQQGIWSVGILSTLLAFSYWRKCWDGPKKLWEMIDSVVLLLFPFFLLLLWCELMTGHPFFILQEHKKWGRVFDLMAGLKCHLPKFDEGTFCLYLQLWTSYVLLKERKNLLWIFLGLLSLAYAEVPLCFGGFMSYTRIASANLGLFIALMMVFRTRPVWLLIWLLWSVSRIGVFSHSQTFGSWVG